VIIRMGAEDTVRRFLICIACLCVLKIAESWLLGSWLMQEEETRTKIRDPLVSHPRCDACRASALLLDSVLRKADAKIEAAGGELEKEEVEQIINHVCHVSSYHNVELVEWEGKARLAHPHLETWEKRGVPHLQGQGMHWAGRVSDHCHYLIGHQRMDAAELYDLWLRAGYRATEEWVKFLCEGEGVFADCLEELPMHAWPATDGQQPVASGPVQFTENF